MLGITPFGMFHTIISLIALFSGAIALVRYGAISLNNNVGKTYVVMTILTCITGFFIFHHGGFGKPHVLGIITLIVLAIAYAGGKKRFGGASSYIETVSYSMTFFFHFIPTITETATRLPAGAPLASSPDDPRIQMGIGICFILFLILATVQVIRLRGKRRIAVA